MNNEPPNFSNMRFESEITLEGTVVTGFLGLINKFTVTDEIVAKFNHPEATADVIGQACIAEETMLRLYGKVREDAQAAYAELGRILNRTQGVPSEDILAFRAKMAPLLTAGEELMAPMPKSSPVNGLHLS